MNGPTWQTPTTLDEALALRSEYGDDGVLVAGGTFVGVAMSTGLAAPERLISLSRVPGLRDVHCEEDSLVVGALTTHAEMARNEGVRQGWSALSDSFGAVASRRIRNRATVGGVLGDADYASDPPAMMAALDAAVWLQSERGMRSVPVSEFIVGHYSTALEPDELITHVSVPRSDASASYWKFRSRSSEDRPCVGVAVRSRVIDGCLDGLRVVVGAVSERPVYFADVCARAQGQPVTQAARLVADGYADLVDPLTDLRGSGAYRKRVIAVGIRRSLEALA